MGVFAAPFVSPHTVRLELGDGHWVDIKRELCYGDLQEAAEKADGRLSRASLQLVATYLVDWSLLDAQGQPVPLETDAQKLSALRALSMEAFAAIDVAITKHVEAQKAEKKAEAPRGRKRSVRTSA